VLAVDQKLVTLKLDEWPMPIAFEIADTKMRLELKGGPRLLDFPSKKEVDDVDTVADIRKGLPP